MTTKIRLKNVKNPKTRQISICKISEKQMNLLENSVTDLKARSMRDNLIFLGIPEGKLEGTEQALQDFL